MYPEVWLPWLYALRTGLSLPLVAGEGNGLNVTNWLLNTELCGFVSPTSKGLLLRGHYFLIDGYNST